MILEIEILIAYFVVIITAAFVCKYFLWLTNEKKEQKEAEDFIKPKRLNTPSEGVRR